MSRFQCLLEKEDANHTSAAEKEAAKNDVDVNNIDTDAAIYATKASLGERSTMQIQQQLVRSPLPNRITMIILL